MGRRHLAPRPAAFSHPTPKIFATTGEAHAYGTNVRGQTLDRLESGQRQLPTDYTAGHSTPINDMLRLGFPLPPSLRQQVTELDRILRIRPTHEWVRVTKTIQAARLFPDVDIVDVARGYRGTFRDHISTSMHPDGTTELQDVERRDVDATIDVPPRTPAIYIGELSAAGLTAPTRPSPAGIERSCAGLLFAESQPSMPGSYPPAGVCTITLNRL